MNMSYVRFENTLKDLYDCRNVLREAGSMEELLEGMSQYEKDALQDMPAVLAEMLGYFDEL